MLRTARSQAPWRPSSRIPTWTSCSSGTKRRSPDRLERFPGHDRIAGRAHAWTASLPKSRRSPRCGGPRAPPSTWASSSRRRARRTPSSRRAPRGRSWRPPSSRCVRSRGRRPSDPGHSVSDDARGTTLRGGLRVRTSTASRSNFFSSPASASIYMHDVAGIERPGSRAAQRRLRAAEGDGGGAGRAPHCWLIATSTSSATSRDGTSSTTAATFWSATASSATSSSSSTSRPPTFMSRRRAHPAGGRLP